jgi:hypothetical protein
MEILDGRVFLGRSTYMRHSPEEILGEMERSGVKSSVVVAPPPGPFYEEANRAVLEAASRYPGRLLPLHRVNPNLEGEEERARRALEEGFIALYLDPANDGYWVLEQHLAPVVRVAGEFEAPLYIPSGGSIFSTPEAIADLASSFSDVDFITSMSPRAPRACRGLDNLYLLTHPFPTLAFKRGFTEGLEVDRLIFSSDSPLDHPLLELKRIELAGLTPGERGRILGGNLRRLLGL